MIRERRALAFVAAFGLVFVAALMGGSFDHVDYGDIGFAVWALLGLGCLFGFLPAATPSPEARRVLVAVGALTAWIALSAIWSESAERSLGELDRALAIGGILVLAALSVTRETWRAAAAGLASAAITIAAIATASRLVPDLFSDATLNTALGNGRLSYPIEYWNGLAGVCGMAVCAGIGYGVHGSSRSTRALSLATVPASALALYLTLSRGGIIATGFGVLVLVAISPRPARDAYAVVVTGVLSAALVALAETQGDIVDGPGTEGGLGVLLALVVFALVAAQLGTRPPGWVRRMKSPQLVVRGRTASLAVVVVIAGVLATGWALDDGGTRAGGVDPAVDVSSSARLVSAETRRSDLWSSAADAFAEHPLAGIGAGSFEFWATRDENVTQIARDAHSLPLETAAELGLIGVLLLLALLWALGVASWRAGVRLRERPDIAPRGVLLAFFGVTLVQASVDWTTDLIAVSALGFGGAMLLATSASVRHGRRRAGTRYGVAAFCLVAAAVQVPGLVAADRTALSEGALAAGLTRTAMEAADAAVTAEPWSASAHAQRAEVLLALGELEDASEDANRAIELESTSWSHRALAARIAASEGDEELARLYLLDVARLRPGIADLATGLASDPSLIVPLDPEFEPSPD